MRAPRPTVRTVLALALVGTLAGSGIAVVGAAQDHPTGRGGGGAGPGADDEASADSASADAHAEERGEGGGSKVKVFRFSGFDINGRLKSPSLLYFLNRLRAEFDHPRLPHRSFMPELEHETAQSKALKE
jgi:hypothetical protein